MLCSVCFKCRTSGCFLNSLVLYQPINGNIKALVMPYLCVGEMFIKPWASNCYMNMQPNHLSMWLHLWNVCYEFNISVILNKCARTLTSCRLNTIIYIERENIYFVREKRECFIACFDICSFQII